MPAALLGWDANQKQLGGWYVEMVYPFVVEGKVTSEHNNQSLPGLVSRLATHSPSFTIYVKDEKTGQDVQTPTEYDNLLNLTPEQTRWLVKGCMALFALVVIWRCRTPTRPRGGWRLSAEYGFILIGMLLFSERTWKHHCVTLVLPFAVLCYHLATQWAGRRLRWGLIAVLAAAGLLMLSTSTGVFDDAARSRRRDRPVRQADGSVRRLFLGVRHPWDLPDGAGTPARPGGRCGRRAGEGRPAFRRLIENAVMAAPANEPWLEVTASRQFPAWLAEQNVSLALTTYQTGKLIMIGRHDGRIAVFERTFNRCMGLWADGQTLWMNAFPEQI